MAAAVEMKPMAAVEMKPMAVGAGAPAAHSSSVRLKATIGFLLAVASVVLAPPKKRFLLSRRP